MTYKVDIKLRDTEIDCASESDMNDLFDDVIQELQALGISADKMIVTKENHTVCDQGYTHNEVIERFGE